MTTPTQLFAAAVQSQDSDERYTPLWVFHGLGVTFDTDPCSPEEGGDAVPVRTKYTRLDDGLAQTWSGAVWCNPPFSNATAFADKFRDHGHGIFLGPIANANWAQDLIAAADLVWLCKDFAFTHPTHAGKRSSMPLMFCAYGDDMAEALGRIHRLGVHRGQLLTHFNQITPQAAA
jgi:hypothetical protein